MTAINWDAVENKSTVVISVTELVPILIPYFLGFFIFKGFFSIFPLYLQVKFGLTDTETVKLWGQIGSVAFFVGAATRLPAGLISDRIGRTRAFALGYSIYIIAIGLVYLSALPIVYMIALSSIRFGVNMFAMTGRAIVSVSKRDKGMKNGLLSAMVGLGSFFGPYLFAFLLDHYPPDTIIIASFFIIAGDFVLYSILLKSMPVVFVKIFPEEKIDVDLSSPPKAGKIHLSALRENGIWEAILLFTVAGLIFGLISSVYAVYGYNVLKLNLTFVGFITGAASLIQVIWAPVVGKLYDYVKDENMRVLGWILVVIGTLSMSFSKLNLYFYIAGLFILNLAISTYFTMEITRIGRVVDRSDFSFVFGLTTSMSILGTAVANSLAPFFYSRSTEGSFVASIFLAVPAFVLVVFRRKHHLDRRKRRFEHPPMLY